MRQTLLVLRQSRQVAFRPLAAAPTLVKLREHARKSRLAEQRVDAVVRLAHPNAELLARVRTWWVLGEPALKVLRAVPARIEHSNSTNKADGRLGLRSGRRRWKIRGERVKQRPRVPSELIAVGRTRRWCCRLNRGFITSSLWFCLRKHLLHRVRFGRACGLLAGWRRHRCVRDARPRFATQRERRCEHFEFQTTQQPT